MREKENAAGGQPAADLGQFVDIATYAPSVSRNGRGCQARSQPKTMRAVLASTERTIRSARTLADAARQAQRQAEQCKELAEACAAAGDREGRWAWLRQRQLCLVEVWAASRPTGQDAGRRPAEECVLC